LKSSDQVLVAAAIIGADTLVARAVFRRGVTQSPVVETLVYSYKTKCTQTYPCLIFNHW